MKPILKTCTSVIAASLCLAGGPVVADADVTLRLSHFLPPAHPVHPALEEWAESLEAATDGSIAVDIYPAQQLGAAFDQYNLARDGIADMAAVNPGYQPGRFPIAGAIELPLMFANATGGSEAVDSWYRAYAEADMPDTHFCMATIHEPATFHTTDQAIAAPSDVQGMRVRTGNSVLAALVESLGGRNVQGSTAQVRDILSRGVADSVIWPWGSLILFGVDAVTPHHLDLPLGVSTLMFVINKGTYDGLSDANRAALDAHCTSEWARRVATPWAEFERAGMERLRADPDHIVTTPTAAQLDEWRAAAEPVIASWAQSVTDAGGDPDAILAALRASVEAHGAGVN